jgi:hypothetical protein
LRRRNGYGSVADLRRRRNWWRVRDRYRAALRRGCRLLWGRIGDLTLQRWCIRVCSQPPLHVLVPELPLEGQDRALTGNSIRGQGRRSAVHDPDVGGHVNPLICFCQAGWVLTRPPNAFRVTISQFGLAKR